VVVVVVVCVCVCACARMCNSPPSTLDQKRSDCREQQRPLLSRFRLNARELTKLRCHHSVARTPNLQTVLEPYYIKKLNNESGESHIQPASEPPTRSPTHLPERSRIHPPTHLPPTTTHHHTATTNPFPINDFIPPPQSTSSSSSCSTFITTIITLFKSTVQHYHYSSPSLCITTNTSSNISEYDDLPVRKRCELPTCSSCLIPAGRA
jgi:hypothetical protein